MTDATSPPPAGAALPIAAPISDREGIIWPAIPEPGYANLLALQYQFEQSQWWPPETLLAAQLRQIEALIAHARRTVPFYRDWLESVAGLAPGELTLEEFQRIPLVRRTDLQDSPEAFVTRDFPRDHGGIFDIQTSGSTGRPVALKGTDMTKLYSQAVNLRFHIWHRRDFSARVAVFRSTVSPANARAAANDTPVQWVPGYRSGPMHLFDITRPVGEQLAWLARQNPDYLLTSPSNLKALLRRAEETGVKLPRLRQVNTMSEVLDPDASAACERIWGASVVDNYSTTEAGMVALQCPEHPHYHVQSEHVLVEVLDSAGDPCSPGEIGRITLTSLHNFATPLIRYEIGDHAEVGEACCCGRGLPVLKRILGRTRNMVVLPTGDQIWPIAFVSKSLMRIAPVRQIQLTQISVEEIDVNLVVAQPLSPNEEEALRGYMVECIGHPFALNFIYVDEIPRSANGKYEDFICLVDPAAVKLGG